MRQVPRKARLAGATHTPPTPNNTHRTYTYLDVDVRTIPHRAPAHTANPNVLTPTRPSMLYHPPGIA